jgi:hypothetical protein
MKHIEQNNYNTGKFATLACAAERRKTTPRTLREATKERIALGSWWIGKDYVLRVDKIGSSEVDKSPAGRIVVARIWSRHRNWNSSTEMGINAFRSYKPVSSDPRAVVRVIFGETR